MLVIAKIHTDKCGHRCCFVHLLTRVWHGTIAMDKYCHIHMYTGILHTACICNWITNLSLRPVNLTRLIAWEWTKLGESATPQEDYAWRRGRGFTGPPSFTRVSSAPTISFFATDACRLACRHRGVHCTQQSLLVARATTATRKSIFILKWTQQLSVKNRNK